MNCPMAMMSKQCDTHSLRVSVQKILVKAASHPTSGMSYVSTTPAKAYTNGSDEIADTPGLLAETRNAFNLSEPSLKVLANVTKSASSMLSLLSRETHVFSPLSVANSCHEIKICRIKAIVNFTVAKAGVYFASGNLRQNFVLLALSAIS
ncbi:hypothetical protein BpHYR1_004930 [Brachionus plicatilis]|uniref:Uncharacterized protein n=1 Tax=Brachionus plicatilis TaxID=10195 RepID=A0A3M7S0V0_BRAPC|nr:hypothetical protein BpHYR1_004930 [Brachionus plicatilis]